MKTNELMLNDWVLHKGTTKRVKTIWSDRFASLYDPSKDWGSIYADKYEASEISPIPLTPEILEKNEFRYNDMPFVQGWEQFGLTLYHGGDRYLINCGENVAMKINAVHELQHALRLCGIEKEIEL